MMNTLCAMISFLEVLHQAILRDIRRQNGNVVAVILMEMAQMVMLVGGFYLMNTMMHFGGNAIRGDLLLYLVTGIFFFQVHVRTVGSVLRAEGPGSQLMRHGNVSPALTITAAAFGTLYTQIVAAAIVLAIYHQFISPISIHEPVGFASTFAISWIFGVSVGLWLVAVKSRAPNFANILSQVYSRANMLASGQMFVANTLPSSVMVWFSWNPLFHLIDQARGFAFLNYSPWFTDLVYPIRGAMIVFLTGALIEWSSRRKSPKGLHA